MTQVTMPQLGESVTEGTILKWLKQPGDAVALDDSLCEIETEKVTAELPSPFEGTMGAILVPEGETVVVGSVLCEVDESSPAATGAAHNGTAQPVAPGQPGRPPGQPGVSSGQPGVSPGQPGAPGQWSGGPMAIPPEEEASPVSASEAAAPVAVTPAALAPMRPQSLVVAHPDTVAAPVRKPEARERFYSPAVMRLAHEHAVDLGGLSGTGIGGRVTRKDLEQAIASGTAVTASGPAAAAPVAQPPALTTAARPLPAAGTAYDVVPFSATRRTIAENLKRSNLEAPQAWTMVEADVTALMALRTREKERFQQHEGVELTLLPYFTSAVCETLREFPVLNSRWEGDELRQYRSLEIGIAVASEAGLVVPVVHAAGDLSVAGLAKRIADLAQRAHTRKLRLEDIEGGTFTVNNTGSFGSIASKPIVNYPQVGIVTMERAVKRPVVLEHDAIAVRWMINVCLSFDHRAMDGLAAGGFLAALKARLEGMG